MRAKPVSDRRQRQLTAWAAAIEDRTDTEASLEILQMKDPAAAKTARDDQWRIKAIESAIVNPDWVMPALPALTAAVPSLNANEDDRSSQQTGQAAEIAQQMSVTNGKEGYLSVSTAKTQKTVVAK